MFTEIFTRVRNYISNNKDNNNNQNFTFWSEKRENQPDHVYLQFRIPVPHSTKIVRIDSDEGIVLHDNYVAFGDDSDLAKISEWLRAYGV